VTTSDVARPNVTSGVTPEALAAVTVSAAAQPLLVALDVDGVLAPIVDRPERARLLPGVSETLADLAAYTPVAVVSGRALGDLEDRYAFPPPVSVIGSHGLEARGRPRVRLDRTEQARLHLLTRAAEEARGVAGDGAWLEHKPASVVLHLREARPQRADRATRTLVQAARRVPGAEIKLGHAVVELFARHTSKGTAVLALRDSLGCSTVAFAGDDLTDEEVFVRLDDHDVTVRVGPGESRARFRLADPDEVLAWLRLLLAALPREQT
jgi:trehalose 6-phosphate phosphatase